ncbi:hypothetical protein AK830_g270 [Neonectria ditissima]|uniref:CBM-cenC domain-containing protein n=1 Tax=Neonectria ditissima TaxID=78410 RepID=A0A0P7BYB0_9HYPO|nr:hypothetical protein AK830_g270 [Neonectria ditissima]
MTKLYVLSAVIQAPFCKDLQLYTWKTALRSRASVKLHLCLFFSILKMVARNLLAALVALSLLETSGASPCKPSTTESLSVSASETLTVSSTSESTTSAISEVTTTSTGTATEDTTTSDLTTTATDLTASGTSTTTVDTTTSSTTTDTTSMTISTTTSSTSTQPTVTNLCSNGDFEGSADEAPTIEPWELRNNQVVTLSIEDDETYAYRSKHSMRVTFAPTTYTASDFVSEQIDASKMEANALYVFTAKVRFNKAKASGTDETGCSSAKAYCSYGQLQFVGTADQVYAADAIDTWGTVTATCQFTQAQLEVGNVRTSVVYVCRDSYGWMDDAKFAKA